MKRRMLTKIGVILEKMLLLCILLGSTTIQALLTPSGRRPSVLLVISDDLRYDYMFSSNVTSNVAPYELRHIERLMASGITFENAFSNFASCGPSRQSMLTGRVPDALGVWNQLDSFRQKGSAPRSLPEHLINEGYTTISVGKVFHYDRFYGVDETLSWSEAYLGAPSSSDSKCKGGSYFCVCTAPDCADLKIARKAISLLPRLSQAHFAGTPFFMAVGFRRPHLDWRVPKAWNNRDISRAVFPLADQARNFPSSAPDIAFFACDKLNQRGEVFEAGGASISRLVSPKLTARMRTAYWASVAYMDQQLGSLLNALKQQSLESETIVIFTSDHGYSLGERAYWCKQSMQDVAVRVPLVMSLPWMPSLQGTRNRDTVDLLDLYPTIAGLLNLRLPDKCLQGRDLTPIIESDFPAEIILKEFSIASYPRCSAGNATANTVIINTALTSSTPCAEVGSQNIVVMGYSIRTKSFRYTQWRKWISPSQIADWSNPGLVAAELYDHRLNVNDANPADFENENLVGTVKYSMIELTMRNQLETTVKASSYSNRRCGVTNVPQPPQGTVCGNATTVQQCSQLFALRCAWFLGYGCQESTFCGFLTKDRVVKNKKNGKTPHKLEEGAPGCSLFSSRCLWKKNKCTKRIESELD